MIELAITLTWFIPCLIIAHIVDRLENKKNEKIIHRQVYRYIWQQKMKNDVFNVYMK